MNIEELMMPIDEWNKQFSCKYMQQPISFLTEENLDRLQKHCEKTMQYGNGRVLEEHQVTLELIIRYKELKAELEKEKEKNKKVIKYCKEKSTFQTFGDFELQNVLETYINRLKHRILDILEE